MTNPTFQIPKDVIEPIIQAQVALAVAGALGDGNKLMESAVQQVLEAKVDSDGKRSSYSSDRDLSWIQWAMHSAVKNAVKDALEEEMAKHKDQIKKRLVTMLQKKNSPLLNQLVEGMAGAMTDSDVFRYKMNIVFDGKR